MPWICHCCGDQHLWPWWVEANAFSSENSCKNSCSVSLEAPFYTVEEPMALAELLAAVPEDTRRIRHSQTR